MTILDKTLTTTWVKTIATTTLGMAMTVGAPVGISMLTMSSAQAAPASEATAAKNLNKLLTNVKSMSANFTQTTAGASSKGSLSGGNRSFSGTMDVQRPNKFRWQVNGSAEQLIVANGNTLWIYDKDLNQATRQRVDAQVGNTPALLLSGNPGQIMSNFKVSQPNAAKNYYVLTPKNGNANFKSLGIAFNSGNPVMMVLNDNLGQTTSIKFSNIKRNNSVAASKFSFAPPKGVDVIDQ